MKPTQIVIIQEKHAATMLKVCGMLQWTKTQYCWFKYRRGLAFLERYLRETMYGSVPDNYKMPKWAVDELAAQADMMQRSKLFWGWWKHEWYERELDFLAQEQEAREVRFVLWSVTDARYIYRDMNNPKLLANSDTHWGKKLEDSYCKDVAGALK